MVHSRTRVPHRKICRPSDGYHVGRLVLGASGQEDPSLWCRVVAVDLARRSQKVKSRVRCALEMVVFGDRQCKNDA
jgi:hypothetical protein